MKKKHIAKLSPGDSTVVLSYDTLMYLASTCDTLADDQPIEEDAAAWRSLGDEIRFQTQENHYDPEMSYEEW